MNDNILMEIKKKKKDIKKDTMKPTQNHVTHDINLISTT